MTNLGAGTPDLGPSAALARDAAPGAGTAGAPTAASHERALLDHALVAARLHSACSHELRGQLNALVLNFEVLKELARAGDVGGEVRECLTALEGEFDRFKPSFESFLRLTRAPDAARQTCDATALVAEACRRIAPVLHQQRAELATRVPSVPVTMRGQRDLLLQGMVAGALAGFDRTQRGGRIALELVARAETLEITVTTHRAGASGPAALLSNELDAPLLEVARGAIASHGGRLSIEAARPGETRLRIEIPTTPPSD